MFKTKDVQVLRKAYHDLKQTTSSFVSYHTEHIIQKNLIVVCGSSNCREGSLIILYLFQKDQVLLRQKVFFKPFNASGHENCPIDNSCHLNWAMRLGVCRQQVLLRIWKSKIVTDCVSNTDLSFLM